MKHDDARQLLDDYLAGGLEGAERGEIEEHLERCADCREWVEESRLFARALGTGDEHPTSDQLARQAVDPGLLEPLEQRRLADHLRRCEACRRQLELTASALGAARESSPRRRAAGLAAVLPRALPARLALAASVILALALGLVPRPAETPGDARADLVLSDEDLRGSQVVVATGSVVASSVIEAGSDVVIRAGESVVLGNGFAVSPGARFAVEAGRSAAAPSPDGA